MAITIGFVGSLTSIRRSACVGSGLATNASAWLPGAIPLTPPPVFTLPWYEIAELFLILKTKKSSPAGTLDCDELEELDEEEVSELDELDELELELPQGFPNGGSDPSASPGLNPAKLARRALSLF